MLQSDMKSLVIESGLQLYPHRLRGAIQGTIDEIIAAAFERAAYCSYNANNFFKDYILYYLFFNKVAGG